MYKTKRRRTEYTTHSEHGEKVGLGNTERGRESDTERNREREKQREGQREKETKRDTKSGTERDRERETESDTALLTYSTSFQFLTKTLGSNDSINVSSPAIYIYILWNMERGR
jgi:hypothetical protein